MKIREASKYSIYNMEEIGKSSLAGCYHCMKSFPASDVTDTTDNKRTALCPNCGIDSVLPDNTPFKLNREVLKQLNAYWFAD